VDEFVNIATAEGFSVFEHTLGWYSKKTAGYVKSYTCITVWGVNDANNWWLN
jgi:GH35 family endo-1,4-beta-xylanase